MRRASLGLVLVVTLACEPPVLGAPCNSGDDPYELEPNMWLVCTGRGGCDDPVGWVWQEYGLWGGRIIVGPQDNLGTCGCDGEYHRPPIPDSDGLFQGPPNHHYRHWDDCEDPGRCRYVLWSESRGHFSLGSLGPVAPACLDCAGATGRSCTNSDGVLVSLECCYCGDAALEPDGRCTRLDGALEVDASCWRVSA